MAEGYRKRCAACGARRELHRHHLIPRFLGGRSGPTIMLCDHCHAQVHGMAFTPNHRALTIAGLQRARAEGKRLGSPTLRPGTAEMARLAGKARAAKAQRFAERLRPDIEAIRAEGHTSLRAIGEQLQSRGLPTPAGGERWSPTQVDRVLRRLC